MVEWQELFVEASTTQEKLDRPPPRHWYREFDTSDEGEREEWNAFLYNPLEELRRAGIVGDEPGWRVATLIVNHHRPLNPRIGIASAFVDDTDQQIGLTIYKVE